MDATPIVYGLVTMPGRDANGRPEFIPGGCTVMPGLPTRECQRCAARYGRVEDEPDDDWDDDQDERLDSNGDDGAGRPQSNEPLAVDPHLDHRSGSHTGSGMEES